MKSLFKALAITAFIATGSNPGQSMQVGPCLVIRIGSCEGLVCFRNSEGFDTIRVGQTTVWYDSTNPNTDIDRVWEDVFLTAMDNGCYGHPA